LSQSEALLEGLRQGDEIAFETIFHTYYGRVFALAYRLLGSAPEAEDIAQEVFLRLYLRPLPGGRSHNLLAWLLKVATNLGYNAVRARRRREVKEDVSAAERLDSLGVADEILQADTAGRVRQVLALLPERQMQILLLRHEGLSYAEVATALGIAPGSVGTLLARAERAFQQLYKGLEEKRSDG
jgi:RNA polymerase sigma-70 factor (ECF subfamily)